MLNMQTASPIVEDLTARARIRDAAIERFAETGVDGTSIRTIAEEAGVSPALVIHHFGTKHGLRTACDEHVVKLIAERKIAAMGQGPSMDPIAALRAESEETPVMRYLARTLVDGSPAVVDLVDGMATAGIEAIEEGVRSGMLEPVEDPECLSALLTIWSLGALVLHDHVERLLGADVTGAPQGRSRYMRVAITALRGLLTEEAYTNMKHALEGAEHEEDGDHG